jgi:hypothetical protein
MSSSEASSVVSDNDDHDDHHDHDHHDLHLHNNESSEEDASVESKGNMTELECIQSECSAMVQLLKSLESEEHDLQCQLQVLAREALLCGFSPTAMEPPAPKRRRTLIGGIKKQATEDS